MTATTGPCTVSNVEHQDHTGLSSMVEHPYVVGREKNIRPGEEAYCLQPPIHEEPSE